MNPAATLPASSKSKSSSAKSLFVRYFYSAAGFIILILMLLGFQQFYLQGKAYPGRELAPPIKGLLILHGLSMTAWVLLFALQPILIASGERKLHMTLGKIGAVLAALVVILGLWVSVAATRIAPDMIHWTVTPKQFMAVPMISILCFAVFVGIGVWNRKKPQIHRPLMLLATLAAIPAAVARIGPISKLYLGTPLEGIFGPFLATLVIGAVLVVLRQVFTRAFDRWLTFGFVSLAIIFVGTMQFSRTPAWDAIASLLLG